jgi:SAM-dependent methyltransferase
LDTANIKGHRALWDDLQRNLPREDALQAYVGSGKGRQGTALTIGWSEREAISHLHDLDGASIVDIGCGIGRLTRYLVDQPIRHYLGIDIVEDIVEEARATAAGDPRFAFRLVDKPQIPAEQESADIVCAFSVITHLLPQEVFAYFSEAARVLRSGSVGVFSFNDYALPKHRANFLNSVKTHAARHDLLTWFERPTLRFFAEAAGLAVVKFIDAGRSQKAKFAGTALLTGKSAPSDWSLGQSLLYLRKP